MLGAAARRSFTLPRSAPLKSRARFGASRAAAPPWPAPTLPLTEETPTLGSLTDKHATPRCH